MAQRPSAPEELRRWSDVDAFIGAMVQVTDADLEAALADSRAAGLPEIQVSPLQGKFLHLLARLRGARRILELGTLGGYSTLWLARALPPDGHLVSLELSPEHARVARANLARAGMGGRAEIRIGPALEGLERLRSETVAPFDLVFIDADKPRYPEYLERVLGLTRPGSAIVVDNVARRGDILEEASPDPNVQGVRRMYEMIARDRRLSATALQTVGVKGHDGFLLAVVLEGP